MSDQPLPAEMAVTSAFGIDEIKKVLKFVIELGKGLDASLSDGKIGVTDALNFYGALMAAGPAFSNIKNLPAQIANLNQAESDEIEAYVQSELKLSDAALEKAVEGGLDLALKLFEFVKSLKK